MECFYDICTFSLEIGDRTLSVSKTGYIFVDLRQILPVYYTQLLECCINFSHQFITFKLN